MIIFVVQEVLLVLAVRENLAGDDERNIGFSGGVERQVETLLGADAAERQREVTF